MRLLKLFTGLVGLVAVLASVPLVVSGGALVWWSADGDTTPLPTVAVSTDERAIVAGDIGVFAGDRRMFLPDVAEASLRAGGDLFVGVGPTAEVSAYLADGTGAPGDQTFWVHRAEAGTDLVSWDVEPGRWSAVVMNADGSPGVDAMVQASVPSAPLRVAGAILAVLGIGTGVVGTLLVGAAWGGRRYRSAPRTVATA